MKNFLFALILLSSMALQAQETNSIAALQRKSNLKITMVKTGWVNTQSPFYLNNRRYFGFEYERHLKGRHALTAGASIFMQKRPYGFNNLKWHSIGVELGYRYYLLPFKGKQPFNGIYTGLGISGYYNTFKQASSNNTSNYYYKNFGTLGNIKLGVQTTFLRRFTLDIEGNYTVDRFFLRRNEYFNKAYNINTTLRIGYTF